MGYMVLVDEGHSALATAIKNSDLHLAWGDRPDPLLTPANLSADIVTSGGNYSTGASLSYVVVAKNYFGATLASIPAAAEIVINTSKVNLTWDMVVGATSYDIYLKKSTDPDYYFLANTSNLTFADLGDLVSNVTKSPPLSNTTSFNIWTDTPDAPNPNHNKLFKELGRRKILLKKYVIPDVAGSVVTSQGRWTEVNYPTKYLYLQVGFDFLDAPTDTIYQFAVFANTVPTAGQESTLYLTPDHVSNVGSLLALENTPPIFRNVSSRVIHDVVIVF